ncbi:MULTISPECIES: hypothetical protein [Gammaproteobacteria]|jgi:hypothetical protein|uniref:hypothetical protein n=1 Tax=Gammaproteobacteria TaxID=1236 RepID=UPI0013E06192|nr:MULTISPECIES: hypothetical protein [Gammaproteobacteria]MCC4284234.1 hypothetical protein [Marinobacter salarius]MCZ4284134.1 hypothetical protein [Marinobacter salarius]MDC8457859.1 hypothetical protein [Marinobacter sp. DS40M6]MDC9603003.1 hypothetical protein [Pseudoalteromonas sp. GABNS16G]MDC9611570.1 hypothetical protein [Pseudoalteromonas sp. GABNS16H]|tara:strand:- start:21 stop:179 length:159 start_codon:yes stop_codon:yes gene_type:complete
MSTEAKTPKTEILKPQLDTIRRRFTLTSSTINQIQPIIFKKQGAERFVLHRR